MIPILPNEATPVEQPVRKKKRLNRDGFLAACREAADQDGIITQKAVRIVLGLKSAPSGTFTKSVRDGLLEKVGPGEYRIAGESSQPVNGPTAQPGDLLEVVGYWDGKLVAKTVNGVARDDLMVFQEVSS